MTGPSIIYHLGVYWWACVDEPLSQVTSYSRPCAWEPPVLPQSLYSPAHPIGLEHVPSCWSKLGHPGAKPTWRTYCSDRPHLCLGPDALRGTLTT